MINLIHRRRFLERSLRLALGTAASASLSLPACFRRALAAGALPVTNKKLLFIFLRGGNDGLNTVIPWGDDAYSATTRPSLYLPPPDPLTSVTGRTPDHPDLTRVIDLGNGFAGLHPALKDLGPVFNAGQLALLHRVAYSKQSRSHFDSQRYWENGVPRDDYVSDGVFYRAVVDTGLYQGRQFPAVSVQSSSPLSLQGAIAFPNLYNPARYDLLGLADAGADKAKLLAATNAGYAIPYPVKDNRDLIFATGKQLESSIDALKTIGVTGNAFFDQDGVTHLFPVDTASNQKKFSGSAFGFFSNLKTAAQVLAHTDAVVAGTQLDGFDTHTHQGSLTGNQAQLLGWIGWAFYALRRYFLDVSPQLWDDTVVVTLSEFGRTSKENGSLGTDHAEASVMFLAGGKVAGGVYQCDNHSWKLGPTGSMFLVNNRYLGRTIDYRSVLGKLIRDHLGATQTQLETILPGYADPLEHLQNGGIAPDGFPIIGEPAIL